MIFLAEFEPFVEEFASEDVVADEFDNFLRSDQNKVDRRPCKKQNKKGLTMILCQLVNILRTSV